MHKKNAALWDQGGMPQGGKQRGMARHCVQGAAQRTRPPGDHAGAVAARGKPLPKITAISVNGRFHSCSDHPSKQLARIGGKLQLQQLVPHLLLRAPQKDDVTGGSAGASENAAPEIEEFVDRGKHRAALPEVITEIYDPITVPEPFADYVVQMGEAPGHTMNDGDRPDPPGTPQEGKSSVWPQCLGGAIRRGSHHPRALRLSAAARPVGLQ